MEDREDFVDPFNLQRFVEAQGQVYGQVKAELRRGRKQSHWMWFIFPQVAGLGRSPTSRFYAIQSRAEARAYLGHPVLGARLRECAAILLNGDEHSAEAIFGQPDTMKFQSSLTLFAALSDEGSIFAQALERFFKGQWDQATLAFLERNP
jgi:uncharacterized protein (DUF1810 family)